ncbi:hypothetical protein [Mangrovibrevibacter kandeliae]|uniref:hypothetical protein n=1 Tax=Mangrovibrevibacter kandeliae TaxID=2968473 RepID=UPI00211792FB|nr:hypothetical protein [Aurantimonas sp. CSK15Z-1]MCQ8782027.1 hypothetical protein [Aurantimonas sp. CSK15Z-1]
MSTEPLVHAKFDHPKHGEFERPDAVLDDPGLSEAEKQEVLEAWIERVRHEARPDAPEPHPLRSSLDAAIERLASART